MAILDPDRRTTMLIQLIVAGVPIACVIYGYFIQ